MARNQAKAFPKEPQLNFAGEGKVDLAPETAACIFGKEAGTKLGKSSSEEDAGASMVLGVTFSVTSVTNHSVITTEK